MKNVRIAAAILLGVWVVFMGFRSCDNEPRFAAKSNSVPMATNTSETSDYGTKVLKQAEVPETKVEVPQTTVVKEVVKIQFPKKQKINREKKVSKKNPQASRSVMEAIERGYYSEAYQMVENDSVCGNPEFMSSAKHGLIPLCYAMAKRNERVASDFDCFKYVIKTMEKSAPYGSELLQLMLPEQQKINLVSYRDPYHGLSLLSWAIASEYFQIADQLLAMGQNINENFNGGNILHHLAYAGSPESINYALSHGAQIYANKEGKTPHDIALYRNKSVAELF